MKKHHRTIKPEYVRIAVLGGLVGAGLLFMLAIAFGYYPIAVVNGSLITAKTFESQARATERYQQAVLDTYVTAEGAGEVEQAIVDKVNAPESQQQLATRVLDALVEERIIREGLADVVGDGAANIVRDKVSRYEESPEIAGASSDLFGLTASDFREAILRPQAEREVLSSKLFLQGQTITNWLKDQRQAASVRIFSGTYAWVDGKVVRK